MINSIQQKNFICSSNTIEKSENLPPPLPIFSERKNEINNSDYRYEIVRLKSFQNWPISFIKSTSLAAAGFYYVGKADRVRCFECQIEIYKWEEGDIPMVDHERSSPSCRFIRNIPCGNVPIDSVSDSIISSRPQSQDVCGMHDIENRVLEPNQESIELHFSNKLKSLGLKKPRPPAYPKYCNLESRLRTFDAWPKSLPDKKQLAYAGFFYTGRGDQTLCYHCGGGLQDWEPKDDPWDEHSKWFSKCYYLLLVKGEEYVNAVTGQCVKSSSKKETSDLKLLSFIKKIEPISIGTIPEQTNLENNPSSSVNSENNGTGSLSSTSCSSTTEDKNVLYSKNKKKSIDDGRLCKICYNEEMSIVFIPCKHIVSCLHCASAISECPICREPIELVIKAILS
ncbi:putative inhibitor of apoptosis isoform X2 [Vespula squamosa]|uniref:Inhibitor of apoptosis isoform X2 n=1 Tax=Vespula squamosa TaxID=30214 RepID=A0ABD1ZW44_VESSQ